MQLSRACLASICHTAPALRWLLLAVGSLTISGILAILLVIARTPVIHTLLPYKDFFKVTLIIHVNMAVLVFMLTITAMLWNLLIGNVLPRLAKISWISACCAALLLATSPYVMDGEPLLNNYVPIFHQPIFISGLLLFAVAMLIELTRVGCSPWLNSEPTRILPKRYDIIFYLLAITVCVAGMCFVFSFLAISKPEIASLFYPEDYFDLMLWGGGHVLQFTYTLGMLLAWLILAERLNINTTNQAKLILAVLTLHVLLVMPSPAIYGLSNITDFEHMHFFTQQMKHAGGIASIIIGGLLIYKMARYPLAKKPIERNILISSIALFAVGGMLGHMISGVNVTIPAHYHGSIVGVTIAFMGLVYLLLEKFGHALTLPKTASWQPLVYAGGQLLHIIGLAWSGGYGVLRKTPGAMETIEAKISMGLMGFGGLISIIGGILFVVVCIHALMQQKDCVEK